jgi:hypothetical protein
VAPHARRELELHASARRLVHGIARVHAAQLRGDGVDVVDHRETVAEPRTQRGPEGDGELSVAAAEKQ